MRVRKDTVDFYTSDMHFVSKFGVIDAADMVLDFRSTHKIPFIYDTYQLSEVLGLSRKLLFKMTRDTELYYYYVTIKKRSGGVRKLCVPCDILKYVQRSIIREILTRLPVSKYATAYKKGSCLVDNASPHCGKKYLLKMDLKDFFDSITYMHVYRSVFNTGNFPKQVGAILTQLCTRNDVLPQGAPTSPMLSNLVMKNFDDTFGAWCERHNLSYTRYCDDITVSGDIPLYSVYLKAKSMLSDMGFVVNEKKTRFIKNTNKQTVTGLTVNESVRVDSKYKRALRQEIYYALKFSAESAMFRSTEFKVLKNESMDRALQRYVNSLIGKSAYVLQIEPQNEYFASSIEKLIALKDEIELDIKRSTYFTFY